MIPFMHAAANLELYSYYVLHAVSSRAELLRECLAVRQHAAYRPRAVPQGTVQRASAPWKVGAHASYESGGPTAEAGARPRDQVCVLQTVRAGRCEYCWLRALCPCRPGPWPYVCPPGSSRTSVARGAAACRLPAARSISVSTTSSVGALLRGERLITVRAGLARC